MTQFNTVLCISIVQGGSVNFVFIVLEMFFLFASFAPGYRGSVRIVLSIYKCRLGPEKNKIIRVFLWVCLKLA